MNQPASERLDQGGSAIPADGRRVAAEPTDSSAVSRRSLPTIDLRELYAQLHRNRWWFIVLIPLALIAGVLLTMGMTPKYDAFASVQIDQLATRVMQQTDTDPNADFIDADRFLKTQVDVLGSQLMQERVAEREHLYGSAEFFRQMGVKLPDKPAGAMTLEQTRHEATLGLLKGAFGSDLPRDSRVVAIRFRSPNPFLAAKLANAFAEEFVANNLERKLGSTTSARDKLGSQLAQAKAKLEASERQLNDYARSQSLIDTSLPSSNSNALGARSVTTASLVGLNDAYTAAQADRIQKEERWRTASATSAGNMGEVLGNQAIQGLLQQRAEKTAGLAQEKKRHRDDYPTVVQAKADLAELNHQIDSISGGIRRSVHDDYTTALRQEQELAAKVQALKTETLSEQDRSVQYNILKREVDTNRSLFDGLLQRYKELSAAANVTSNNLSIVDVADVPSHPSSPRLLVNVAVALILGGGLALAITIVREMLDGTVRSPADVEKKLGLFLFGAVPVARRRRNLLAEIAEPDTPLSEAYASLLVPLSSFADDRPPRSICITSSEAGEGKSSSAFAFASGLARRGARVLLIDADLRLPSLHEFLDLPNDVGLADVLAHGVPLASVMRATPIERLTVVTSGPTPPNPSEIIKADSIGSLLELARRSFDVVVLDAPPVLGLADAPVVASRVVCTIFVIESGRAQVIRIRNALKRLRSAKVTVSGAVLTKFKPASAGLAYEYSAEYLSYGRDKRGRRRLFG